MSAAVEEIGRRVIAIVGIPKDRWEVAAQLEVLGYRDADVRDQFGFGDVFDMADQIVALFEAGRLQVPDFDRRKEQERNPILRFLQFYGSGLVFTIPMVLQGGTMLLFGYGLWGAIDLDIRIGSAVALGFIASYIATSGFSWAIVRRGLFYFYQDAGDLARWSALRMWWIGVRVALVLIAPALGLNLIYEMLPFDLFFVAIAYFVGLSLLWLNWSLIYLVGRTWWLIVALAVSILVVAGTARMAGWPVIAANLAGVAVADVLTFLIGLHGLNRWARAAGGKAAVNPPRLAALVYTSAQVFLYGTLYSMFMFADRVLAWTARRGRDDFPPYPFWLSARYELGMDLALMVIVLLAGIVEYSTRVFSENLVPSQKTMRSVEIDRFLGEFRQLDRRHTALLALCATMAIALSALVADGLRALPDARLQESLRSTTTVRVFWVAAFSYAILMFALQKLLTLMILLRADLAMRTMTIALATNLVVGFIISRAIHFSGSVIGLLAGCIVLAVVASRHLRRVLDDLDYNYYAAY